MWLFIPSAFVPDAADSNSELPSPLDIGERLAEASATWRGKHQPPQAWSRRWKQGGFIRLLSGLTLPPSTLDLGVASFISSLRETRVRKTASPESGPGHPESASSPPKSSASPKSAGLILSSARTCRGTRTDSSAPSSRHWKGWAIALRQEYSARPKPEIRCGASDCSSWPRAKTVAGGWERDRNGNVYPTLEGAAETWRGPSDISKRGGSQPPEKRMDGGHSVNLEDQAEHWAGPQARDHFPAHTDDYIAAKKAQGHGMRNLNDEAARWAGPAAQNHKGSSEGSIRRQDGKSRDDLLHYQAEQFFRLPSSPDQPIAGGSMSSTAGPNSNQPSAKRRLNPIFVEALMRWPTGLSGFARPETAWTRWQQLMPSFLSMLCCAPSTAQGDLF